MAKSPEELQDGVAVTRRWGPLALLLAVAAAVYASGAWEYLSLANIAAHRDTLQDVVSRHWLAAMAGFGLIYMATVALSIPGGALLTIVGGFLFGWLAAGLLVVVAATAGATVLIGEMTMSGA